MQDGVEAGQFGTAPGDSRHGSRTSFRGYEAAGEGRKVRASSWVERLYPATPAGGVAGRCLRYWRRDPRYLAGIAGFIIAPVIIIVTQLANPDGLPVLAAFAPALVGWLVGISIAQDLSYDGSGRTDETGALQRFLVAEPLGSRYLFLKVEARKALEGLSLRYHQQSWK